MFVLGGYAAAIEVGIPQALSAPETSSVLLDVRHLPQRHQPGVLGNVLLSPVALCV